MTKNRALDSAGSDRIERVLLANAAAKANDHARLGNDDGSEIERVDGIHVAVRNDDAGTAERQAKGDLYTEESDTTRHKRSRGRAPLDKYRGEHALDPADKDNNYRLWKAGQTLRQSFRKANFSPRVTANLLATGGGNGHATFSDEAADARDECLAAMRYVGVVLAPVLVHVVCLEATAGTWATKYGWHRAKDGMTALRLGLESLARHYGI